MSRTIFFLVAIFISSFAFANCEGGATVCSAFAQSNCSSQKGCYFDLFQNKCSGKPKSCSSFGSSGSCRDQNGCFWQASTPTPTPTPSPIVNNGISNLQYDLPGVGLSSIELYSAGDVKTNQIPSDTVAEVWYSHEFDRYGNSRVMSWNRPTGSKTIWQFKIVNGAGSITGNNPNYSIWTTLYNTSETEEYLRVLPGHFFNDFYENKVNLPTIKHNISSKNYVLIFYRVGTEINGSMSDWKYLKPIWLYSAD